MTFLLLYANYGLMFSQDYNQSVTSVRIESGYAFTGSGDLDGYFISNEYGRFIGDHFRIGPAISFNKYSGIQPESRSGFIWRLLQNGSGLYCISWSGF